MAAPVVTLRIPVELLARIDQQRGGQTRSAFILTAVQKSCNPPSVITVGGGGGAGGGHAFGGPIVVQQTVKRPGQVQPRWKKPKA